MTDDEVDPADASDHLPEAADVFSTDPRILSGLRTETESRTNCWILAAGGPNGSTSSS